MGHNHPLRGREAKPSSIDFRGNMKSANMRRLIAAGMIGNLLEWYDFAIYGYFAAQIGRQFFPHERQSHSFFRHLAFLRSAF
jgi:hypothetical protein